MTIEIRLYSYQQNHFQEQFKCLNNLKYILQFYSIFATVSLTYSIVNFVMNKKAHD